MRTITELVNIISSQELNRNYKVPLRDPADDGPEVNILRENKVIVRQGDDFILGFTQPRVKGRYY